MVTSSFILEHLPASISFAVIALGLVWYFGYKFGAHLKKCEAHDTAIFDLTRTIPPMAVEVGKIGTRVEMIYGLMNLTSPNSSIASHSPISLTDVGKRIVANIKADEILKKHLPELMTEITSENPQNPYDIQEASMKVAKEKMVGLLSAEEIASIKKEAFDSGNTVENTVLVFGVLLRNYILEEKEIPVLDVDKLRPKL